jgi:putative addiction module component (TIGR02574 family)
MNVLDVGLTIATKYKETDMTVAEIKEMPVNQRIILMEEIWDTLSHEDVEIESPAWHKEILDERMALINSGKGEYLTIEELKIR